MKSDQRWSAMTYNDRATDTWVSWAPGASYIVTCYIINPRAGRGLFTASPHADNVIYTCRYPGFTRRSGQKASSSSQFCKIQPLNSVPVLVDLLSPVLTPDSVHLMIMWREAAPIVMLLHTGAASDTQWDLMKLSPAWRPTGPVLVVTWIMFWCNVFMSWGHGAGDKQQTQPACLARTLQTDIRQCVTEHSLESVAAHPACCQPGPARPGRVQWGGEHGHHTPGGHDGDHGGPLCLWWHPLAMFAACLRLRAGVSVGPGVVTWPAGPVCRSVPGAWCGHTQGSVHSGEPSWESAHSDQEPDYHSFLLQQQTTAAGNVTTTQQHSDKVRPDTE